MLSLKRWETSNYRRRNVGYNMVGSVCEIGTILRLLLLWGTLSRPTRFLRILIALHQAEMEF